MVTCSDSGRLDPACGAAGATENPSENVTAVKSTIRVFMRFFLFLLRLGPRREHSGPSPTQVSSLGNCRGVVLARVTLHNARKRLPAPRKWIYETPASYPQGKQDEKQHFSKSSIDNFD